VTHNQCKEGNEPKKRKEKDHHRHHREITDELGFVFFEKWRQ
jgi:hypothetical protein